MLPSNGPILEYRAEAYTTSDVLVYNRTVENENDLSQYTFDDLDPATTYKLSIIGINNYGVGDASNVLFEASTQSPVGKSYTDTKTTVVVIVVIVCG